MVTGTNRLRFILLSIAFSLVCVFPVRGQLAGDTATFDLIDVAIKVLKISPSDSVTQSERKVRLSLVPFAGNSEGNVSISAVNLAFYRGNPQFTNLSTVYFYPYTNLAGRYSFSAFANFWSNENIYNTLADFKISSNRYDAYSLGSSSSPDPIVEIDYNHFRGHLQVKRLIVRYLYAGFGYAFDSYYDLSNKPYPDSIDYGTYIYGTNENNRSSGFTFNISRDSRKNSITPEGGFFTSASFRLSDPAFGSTYSWNSLQLDIRKYFPISSGLGSVFAIRGFYWDTWGDVPYLELPATRKEREGRTGRGYYYARFRGRGMTYGELEYRFKLSRNGFWGAVVFANMQSVREQESNKFEYVNPAGGAGLRLKLNKRSNANVTLDFAVGKNSWNVYLNLGEFF